MGHVSQSQSMRTPCHIDRGCHCVGVCGCKGCWSIDAHLEPTNPFDNAICPDSCDDVRCRRFHCYRRSEACYQACHPHHATTTTTSTTTGWSAATTAARWSVRVWVVAFTTSQDGIAFIFHIVQLRQSRQVHWRNVPMSTIRTRTGIVYTPRTATGWIGNVAWATYASSSCRVDS